MHRGAPVAVVMPARDEAALIGPSVASVPSWVDLLIVVDDGSTDGTGRLAAAALAAAGRAPEGWPRGEVVGGGGAGVGAAIGLGSRRVLEIAVPEASEGDWLVAVMAGDGQMDPDDLPALLAPCLDDEADHVKGDRWAHASGPEGMPWRRRLGSRMLARLTSLAAGLRVRDPQCGYTVTTGAVLRAWPWARTWRGYGYPNWWLMSAGRRSLRVAQVPCRSVYGSERSGLRISRFLPPVALMLLAGVWSRGWGWYIRGELDPGLQRTAPGRRMVVGAAWFTGWSLWATGVGLAASGAVVAGVGAVVLGLAPFTLVRWIDLHEAARRRRSTFSGSLEAAGQAAGARAGREPAAMFIRGPRVADDIGPVG